MNDNDDEVDAAVQLEWRRAGESEPGLSFIPSVFLKAKHGRSMRLSVIIARPDLPPRKPWPFFSCAWNFIQVDPQLSRF